MYLYLLSLSAIVALKDIYVFMYGLFPLMKLQFRMKSNLYSNGKFKIKPYKRQ